MIPFPLTTTGTLFCIYLLNGWETVRTIKVKFMRHLSLQFWCICTAVFCLSAGSCSSRIPTKEITTVKASETFTNPILKSGADPYSLFHEGYYYYMHTVGDKLVLWKTQNLSDLGSATGKTIWTPPASGAYSKHIWAPEIHFIDNSWYVYFAADDGNNATHRMYVLQNTSQDLFEGNWEFKGKIAAATDKWAIDGNVFEYGTQLYMIWSGWEADENGQQDIYIAKMKNPLEIEGDRVKISSPTYDWEKHGDLNNPNDVAHVNVNEGPQFLAHESHIFIVFSASGCWTDQYSLGLLSFKGESNLLDSSAWVKSPEPVFTQAPENKVYGTGHNSFFKSPNGAEDWILYHANAQPGQGCGAFRSPRMQRISWDASGRPVFGKPVAEHVPIKAPSSHQSPKIP